MATLNHRKQWNDLTRKGQAARERREAAHRNTRVVPELLRAWGIVGAIPPGGRARHSALKGE